jgi:hypothetical protein
MFCIIGNTYAFLCNSQGVRGSFLIVMKML